MGTGSFPGVKGAGHGIDHPLPSSAEVKEKVELYLHSPFVAYCRVNFTFYLTFTTHPVAQCHISGNWNPQLQHLEILKIHSCTCCVQSVFGDSNK